MAVKKSPKKDAPVAKAGQKSRAAKPEAATQATAQTSKAKAAPARKAAAPVKLTTAQGEMLKKIDATAEPGYLSERKAELRTLEALQERKLIKRGAKDKASGNYRYLLSSAGKKHLGAQAPAPSAPAPASAPGTQPTVPPTTP